MAEMTDRTALLQFRAAEAAPDPTALAEGRARLLTATAGDGSAGQHRPSTRRSTAVRVAVGAGMAASVLAGTVIVQALSPTAPTAAAAEALNRAAAAAAAAPATDPGRVRYLHEVETSLQIVATPDTVDVGPRCTTLVETWRPGTGDGQQVRRADGLTLETALAPAAPAAFVDGCLVRGDTTDEGPGPSGLPGDWTEPDPSFLAGLPTDPAALHERARRDATGYADRDAGTLALLRDLALSDSPDRTPALTAALFRAIALVPGIELGAPGRDLFGRSGTVVTRVDEDVRERTELIFDPDSGEFLGERTVALPGHSGPPAGTVLFESSTATAVVDAVGTRPR